MAITFAPVPNFSSKVNITAVKSGNASDPTVWDKGRALQDSDYVSIPAGFNIVWDLTTSPRLGGIIYAGVLDTGSAAGAKQMVVADLICAGGVYKCGSCINNIPLNGTFDLIWTDTAPDPVFDPGQFGTGFVMMGGTADQCGSANKTPWVSAQGAAADATQITMATIPQEWNVGDDILVPATGYTLLRQDEVIKLAAINGNVITLASPLAYDHSVPVLSFTPATWTTYNTVTNTISYTLTQNNDQSVTVNCVHTWKDSVSGQGDTYTGSWTYQKAILFNGNQVSPLYVIGNLSRNITWQSENPNGTRGHHMLMRDMNGKPAIDNACHIDQRSMGRTKATQVVTDPMVDTSFSPPRLVAGTADNPRARYARHSHRQGQGTGYGDTTALQTWDSIVIRDGLKWCYDNHDSNVKCINCIAFDFDGAGFATERGTEIGEFTRCFACGGTGVGDGYSHSNIGNDRVNIARFPADDMGFVGNGIWLQGSGVTVNGCVTSGAVSGGLFWAPIGPQSPQAPGVIAKTMPWANLPPSIQTQLATIGYGATNPPPVSAVPPFGVGNMAPNFAFACADAGATAWISEGLTGAAPGQFTNCLSFNCVHGTSQQYCFHFSFLGTVAIGPYVQGAKKGDPLNAQQAQSWLHFGSAMNPNGYGIGQVGGNNVLIGWDKSFQSSQYPTGPISDGYYASPIDFALPTAFGASGRSIICRTQISGNPIFAPLQQPLPSGQTRFNFHLEPDWPTTNAQDLSQFFDINYLFDDKLYMLPHGWQLYFPQSGDSTIPFPTGGKYFTGFPTQLIGATNAQIRQQLGVGLWGFGPVNPVPCPWTSNGIIGNQMNLGSYTTFNYPRFVMQSAVVPASGNNYVLQVYNILNPSAPVISYPASNLTSGWQFFAEAPAGFPDTFAVYGPSSSPPPPPPPPPIPSTPTGLVAHCNQAVLLWSAATNASAYNIQRSTDGKTYAALASGVMGLTYVDTTVSPASTYYYQVQASNAQGVSAWSAPAEIAVP